MTFKAACPTPVLAAVVLIVEPEIAEGVSLVLHGKMAFVATFSRCQALAAIVFSFGSIQGAHAAEYALGEGKLKVDGSMFVGTAIRTDRQDPALLSNVNSSLLGIDGTAIGGRNHDDGNLNFNRGDPVATVAKGYLTLGYTWRNYGALASAKAWYDYALADSGRPWGNVPNGYSAGEPLSDAGALPRSRFSGIVSDNLYGYGRNEVGSVPVDWKVGYQKLDWGNRYIAMGGLRDLTPVDAPAVLRPGALREEETRIAFPAAFARLGVAPETSAEFFYQFHFQPNAPHECGTFFSQLDFASEGCDKIMVGNVSNRDALASGSFLKRADTIDPSNSGQVGLALKRAVDRWATEFGIYAAQFHSRSSFIGGVNSLRTGPPFIPNDPDNLNPKYFAEYPEDIRIFGLTFDTKMSGGAVFGELTYRPNQPYQYNGVDMINAFVSSTAPTLLRARVAALEPGATFHGYERHKALQLQLGATRGFPNVLGSAELSTGAEIVYKRVPDLPDQSTARFGRSDIFGPGAVDGVCPPPATPTQCSSDGYVSRNAWGYRLRAGLRYANVFDGVDLIPSVAFGHDVAGWSGDQGIIEGRKLAIVSLRANVAKRWTWEIAWLPTWGGTYNSLRDRSTAQTNIGYQF